jgi:hypothetical protein
MSYVPGANFRAKLPRLSVCVDFVAPFPRAVTVASVTRRGGHGRSGRSTGHVGPATTDPLMPDAGEGRALAPGVIGGDVGCGAFVDWAVTSGDVDGVGDVDVAGVTLSALPQPTRATASTTIRTLGRGRSGSS